MVIMWLIMINNNTGWWFFATPLKNHGVKVSWDDDIPNWMESQNPNVPNHQPSIGLKPQFFLIFSVWGIIPSISQTRRCLACFWWNWLPQDVPNIRYLSPWSIYIYIYLSIPIVPIMPQWYANGIPEKERFIGDMPLITIQLIRFPFQTMQQTKALAQPPNPPLLTRVLCLQRLDTLEFANATCFDFLEDAGNHTSEVNYLIMLSEPPASWVQLSGSLSAHMSHISDVSIFSKLGPLVNCRNCETNIFLTSRTISMTLDGLYCLKTQISLGWTVGAQTPQQNLPQIRFLIISTSPVGQLSSTLHTWRLNKVGSSQGKNQSHPNTHSPNLLRSQWGHVLLNHGFVWGCLILGPRGKGLQYLKPPIKSFLSYNKRLHCCKILIRSSTKMSHTSIL